MSLRSKNLCGFYYFQKLLLTRTLLSSHPEKDRLVRFSHQRAANTVLKGDDRDIAKKNFIPELQLNTSVRGPKLVRPAEIV